MPKSSISFFSSPVIIFMLLLFMLEPDGVAEGAKYVGGIWSVIHECYHLLKWITIIAVVPLVLTLGMPSLLLWLIILYNGIIILSCYLNGNLEYVYFRTLIIITIFSVLTEYGLRRVNPVKFLRVFFLLLLIYILINILTMLMYFPDGIYINDRGWGYHYFLGFKNLHIYFFLPCILVLALLQYCEYGKLKPPFYALMGLLLVSSVFSFSTTSLLVMFTLTILSFFVARIKLPRWVNLTTLFVFMTVLAILLIFGGISGEFSEYTQDISDKAGKTGDTFEARVRIWLEALIAVYQHPIIGNGNFSVIEGRFLEYYQMHNQYLDIVTQGGLILFSVFTLQFVVTSLQIQKIRGTWIYTMIFFLFAVYFMEFMLEGKRNNYLWFPFLLIAYHIPIVIERLEKSRNIN